MTITFKFAIRQRVRIKDLLYSQQRVMSEYVQILGKRLERAEFQFQHAKASS